MEDHQPYTEPLSFELEDGTVCPIPPMPVGQARVVLMADPNAGQVESHRDNVLRMIRQAAVLFERAHVDLMKETQPLEAAELSRELYLTGWGRPYEPTPRVPGLLYVYAPLGSLADIGKLEGVVIELSIVRGKSEPEIDAMPLLDALAQSTTADVPAGWQPRRSAQN